MESHVPSYSLPDYAVNSKREPPRARPVASKETSFDLFRSHHRETPPDKPGASLRLFTHSLPRLGSAMMTRTLFCASQSFPQGLSFSDGLRNRWMSHFHLWNSGKFNIDFRCRGYFDPWYMNIHLRDRRDFDRRQDHSPPCLW